MSLLEDQLKELQLRKCKVTHLKSLLELLEGPQTAKDEKLVDTPEKKAELQVEVEVRSFILKLIDSIENGTSLAESVAESQFTDEEVLILKEVVDRYTNRPQDTNEEPTPAAPRAVNNPMERQTPRRAAPPRQPPPRKGGKDILQFAQEHRHLNGKRVIVNTRDGRVGGTVTGVADQNHLQVSTDTGHNIPVAPENLTLE